MQLDLYRHPMPRAILHTLRLFLLLIPLTLFTALPSRSQGRVERSVSGRGNVIVEADSRYHDFGRIEEARGDVSHVFHLRTDSSSPVGVALVRPSCSCLCVRYPRDEDIVPGKAFPLEVIFSPSGAVGKVERSVEVFLRGGGELVLSVCADVVPSTGGDMPLGYSLSSLRLSAPSVRMGYIFPGEERKMFLRVRSTLPSPRSLRVIPSDPGSPLRVDCPSSLQGGGEGDILITCRGEGGPDMKYTDTLVVFVGGEMLPRGIPVEAVFLSHPRVEGEGGGSSLVVPSRLSLGRRLLSRTASGVLRVGNAGSDPLSIYHVDAAGGLDVDLRDGTVLPPGGSLDVRVSGREGGRLSLFTSDPSRPYKEIEIIVR